jgi:hypothetical protein
LTKEERERRYGFLERLAPAPPPPPAAAAAAAAAAAGGRGGENLAGEEITDRGKGGREEGVCTSTATLTLYEADLTLPHSFDEAIRGCTYVFHVASPVVYDPKADPQKDLLQPALAGVRNVLAAIVKARKEEEEEEEEEGGREGGKTTFKRLILTSSTGAVYGWPAAVPKAAAETGKEGGREGKGGSYILKTSNATEYRHSCPAACAKASGRKTGGREGGRAGGSYIPNMSNPTEYRHSVPG